MDNDDRQIGRILTRREVLRLLGGATAAFLVGCGPEEEGSATALPTASEGMATVAAVEGTPTALVEAVTAEATNSVAAPTCVVRPELTEGPYFVDVGLLRSDIRSDPESGLVKDGVPLTLTFNVSDVSNNSCRPVPGAVVDVWHCDAEGVYSGVSDPGFDTSNQAFLRGYQMTDENGVAEFLTIYPGWYSGRAVHIHFKIRTDPDSDPGYEFTSQLFFDEDLTDTVHAQTPYAEKGQRNTLNSSDNIFDEQLVLTVDENGEGYAATFAIALDLSDAETGQADGQGGGFPGNLNQK